MKTVVAAALGECVHVAGISNFLRLAENDGWRTVFLGPAVPIEKILETAKIEKADLIGISYRLTPETGERLLGQFAEAADDLHASGVKFAFGGTPPVVERAQKLGFFEATFNGTETPEQVLNYLRGGKTEAHTQADFPQTTIERIQWKAPYPIIRHHFGLPTMEASLQDIEEIAASGLVDVISLGIDQEAQENFFHPEKQDPRRRGAGGVPVRSPEDYAILYQASRRGNFPLLRTYTGTDDFVRLAAMYVETIKQAWAAIPLFWFNQMDGRGPWDLEGSIREHQNLMRWYGERNIPVELNEAHHWGMRDAPDVIFVVATYLAAYNARAFGVHDHIIQMMFNSPPGVTDVMDLAKMLAVLKITAPLAKPGTSFRLWKQVRTGLLSYPVDPNSARGHLSASVYLQMALRPHILHVVAFTEANHAATATDLIESVKIAHRSIENAMGGPDMTQDERVQARTAELVGQAVITLNAIQDLASPGIIDPLTDPTILAKAVEHGILDAPQLKNNPYGRGQIATRIDSRGACVAIDSTSGKTLTEEQRLSTLNFG